MALGDYILCHKCEVKLIYDGDRGNREWWVERWGKEPEILCPDCAATSAAEKDVPETNFGKKDSALEILRNFARDCKALGDRYVADKAEKALKDAGL